MRAAWRITADSQDVTAAIAPRLVSLEITDKPGLDSDAVTLTIADHDGAVALPARGVTLRVAIGWRGQALVDRGRYRVDEVSHQGPPDQITVKGRAADLTGGLKAQREDSFHGQTLGDLLGTVAARNGLALAVAPDLARLAIAHVDQTNESDAHFLTRLGEQYDAVATIKDGRLLFTARGSGATAGGATLPALTIPRTATVSHAFAIKDREGKTTGVRAPWRDYDAARTGYATVGDEGSVTTLKRTYPTEAEARAAAQAAMNRIGRGERSLSLDLARGRPEAIAGQPLTVTGFRPEIDAVDWITETVTHTVTGDGGLLTRIACQERTGAGGDGKAPETAATAATSQAQTTWDTGEDWGR